MGGLWNFVNIMVELKRGEIRIPEGYRGQNWERFVKELHSFFPGTAVTVAHQTRKPRNSTARAELERRVIRAGLTPAVLGSRNVKMDSKLRNTRDFKNQFAGSVITNSPRAIMDLNAPRPTRKCNFKWAPVTSTLRITKPIDGPRQAQWVGLKTKAIGLAQPNSRATQAQALGIGSVEEEQDKSFNFPESSPTPKTLVDHDDVKELGSSDEETHAAGELSSSDEDTQADNCEFPLETPVMPILDGSMGDTSMECGYAAVEVEEPSVGLDLALVRVDLAEDF